ncbi:O-antigen ligase family protein [Patescibacteria group bacterium]|nr:O-antigen ligase family protein [Patescibacteria group bacterium]
MKASLNKLKVIDTFIRFFILGAVFLLPLVFDAFSFLDSVFTYPKVVILYIFVAGLFVSTLIKIVYLKKIEINTNVFKHILWPSLYVLVLIISTAFAFDVSKAFWGSYSRQFGLLTHLFLYLWFILLLFNLSLRSNVIKIKEIYKTIALSSFLVSVYAILQYFGIDFFTWREAAISTKRAFSTLGQPNYLGIFLVMVIPIIIYLFKIERNKYLRFFWLIIAFSSILACFFTGSRSAWLGLIATIFISIIYILIKNKKLIKSKTFVLSVLAVIIIFVSFFSYSHFKERFIASLDFEKGSTATRLLYWKASYDKIIQSPIIGYGLEQQKHVLRDAYNKDWAVHEKLNTYSDRAHNIILDQLLVGGIMVLFAYFMILRSWFIFTIRALKTGNYKIAILTLSLFAYLIALLFSFEIIVSSFYFWLFGALIIVGVNGDKDEDNYKIFNLKLPRIIQKIIIFTLLLIFLFFIYLQLQKIIANHYFLASKRAGARSAHSEALLLYNYSKDTTCSHKHYDLYFADSISYALIINNQKPYRELELKLENIKDSLNLNTYDDVFVKARINSALRKYNEADEGYSKAINLVPEFAKTYLALADNYFLQEKYDEALKYYNITIEKIPEISDQRLNKEHRDQLKRYLSLIWEKKGDIYYKKKDYDRAILAFKQAYDYNLYQVPILKKIADSYYFKDDMETAIWYNKKGKEKNPVDPAWPTALAWLYYQQGDLEQAKAELKEALSIREDYSSALDLKKEFNFNF